MAYPKKEITKYMRTSLRFLIFSIEFQGYFFTLMQKQQQKYPRVFHCRTFFIFVTRKQNKTFGNKKNLQNYLIFETNS